VATVMVVTVADKLRLPFDNKCEYK